MQNLQNAGIIRHAMTANKQRSSILPNRPARIAVIATKNLRENPFRDVNLTRAFKARGADATLALLGPQLSAFGYPTGAANAPL